LGIFLTTKPGTKTQNYIEVQQNSFVFFFKKKTKKPKKNKPQAKKSLKHQPTSHQPKEAQATEVLANLLKQLKKVLINKE